MIVGTVNTKPGRMVAKMFQYKNRAQSETVHKTKHNAPPLPKNKLPILSNGTYNGLYKTKCSKL